MSREEDELLALLHGTDLASEPITAKPYIPSKLFVSSYAMDKAYAICGLVREKVQDATGKDEGFEWYSFMVASREDPDMKVTDLVITPGTRAEKGFVRVPADFAGIALEEIKQRNTDHGLDDIVVGWLHSHGDGLPGFSPEDRKNTVKLYPATALNTQRTVRSPIPFEGSRVDVYDSQGQILIQGRDRNHALITLDVQNISEDNPFRRLYDETPEQAIITLKSIIEGNLEVAQRQTIGYGFSIVVDDQQRKPYSEVGITRTNLMSGASATQLQQLPLHIVPDKRSLDIADLAALIDERVEIVHYKPKKSIIYTATPGKTIARPATQKPATYYPQKKYPKTPITYQKHDTSDGIHLDELPELVEGAIIQYFALFRHPQTIYSQYIDEVLGYYKPWGINLAQAIQQAGEPYEDGEEVYFPRMPTNATSDLEKELRKGYYEPDDPIMDFLFTVGSGKINDAVETVIPEILETNYDN